MIKVDRHDQNRYHSQFAGGNYLCIQRMSINILCVIESGELCIVFNSNIRVLSSSKMENAGLTLFLLYGQVTVRLLLSIVKLMRKTLWKRD